MAKLVGGPCDGTPVLSGAPASIPCGGVTYRRAADGDYYPPGGSPSGGARLDDRQLGRAWTGLMRELGVKTPLAVTRSRAARSRMRRTVR